VPLLTKIAYSTLRERTISHQIKIVHLNYSRGVAKADLGDKRGAIDDYNKAIAIDPKNAGAYYNRGALELTLGDPAIAKADYNQSVLLNPQYAQQNYIVNPTTYYSPVVIYNPYYIGGYYIRGSIVYYSPGFFFNPGYVGVGVYRPIIQISPRHRRFRYR
jgi:tetratricopeptide (TPR) repeat protein